MDGVCEVAVSNRKDIVRGNTVFIPEYNPSRKSEDEKYRKLDKAKREAQIKIRKQQTKERLLILRMIVVMFVVGLILLYRYVSVYKMQASLAACKTQEANLIADNESLKLTLAQKSNINSVEDTAINNLHMVRPNVSDAIKVDLSKNNFKPAQDKTNTPTNIFDKLKKILF
jgi:cell division protein FtsL